MDERAVFVLRWWGSADSPQMQAVQRASRTPQPQSRIFLESFSDSWKGWRLGQFFVDRINRFPQSATWSSLICFQFRDGTNLQETDVYHKIKYCNINDRVLSFPEPGLTEVFYEAGTLRTLGSFWCRWNAHAAQKKYFRFSRYALRKTKTERVLYKVNLGRRVQPVWTEE